MVPKKAVESERDRFMETVLGHLEEILDEVEFARENLCSSAAEHINEGDLILTCGYSNSMVDFFKSAAEEIKFELIVLETAPIFNGLQTAKELAKAGI